MEHIQGGISVKIVLPPSEKERRGAKSFLLGYSFQTELGVQVNNQSRKLSPLLKMAANLPSIFSPLNFMDSISFSPVETTPHQRRCNVIFSMTLYKCNIPAGYIILYCRCGIVMLKFSTLLERTISVDQTNVSGL